MRRLCERLRATPAESYTRRLLNDPALLQAVSAAPKPTEEAK
jgi:phosphoribosyl-ATP pyrophosphohydrolase